MHTPEYLRKKALRQYTRFLTAWLTGQNFFPLRLSLGKVDVKDYAGLQTAVDTLHQNSKAVQGYGYIIESETRRTRNIGEQTIPHHIVFETDTDYLRYINKLGEFNHFVADVTLIRQQHPALEAWIQANVRDIINYHGEWMDLLSVCAYFVAHPQPQYYVRELPIEIHTKFIETHQRILDSLLQVLLPDSAYNMTQQDFNARYGLRDKSPMVRVRVLDKNLLAYAHLPFPEFAVPLHTLVDTPLPFQRCIIVENELNFLTLPPVTGAVGIWGAGYKAQILSAVRWLETVDIVYWGDIDVQGFQILSNLRRSFSHIRSVMMDAQTLDAFGEYKRDGTPTNIKTVSNLTRQERSLYQHILENNIRLEQEHINQQYVNAIFLQIDEG